MAIKKKEEVKEVKEKKVEDTNVIKKPQTIYEQKNEE